MTSTYDLSGGMIMIHAKMSRREFLMTVASFFVGALAAKCDKLLRLGNLKGKNSFKEAKYYKTGGRLAG